MRSLVLSCALLLSPAAYGKEFGVGVSGDIGVFIRGLTIGTGGVGVYGSTGVGGVGGKVFMTTDAGFKVGVDGGADWDMSRYYNSTWWWVGGTLGVSRPIGENRSAGGNLTLGYGQGNESVYRYKQEQFVIRVRTAARQDVGPLGLEIGVFAHLPIVLKQTLDGAPYNFGWTPWAGADLTIYFVRSTAKKPPPPPPQDEANRRPPPPEPRPLAIPGDEPPPPPPPGTPPQ